MDYLSGPKSSDIVSLRGMRILAQGGRGMTTEKIHSHMAKGEAGRLYFSIIGAVKACHTSAGPLGSGVGQQVSAVPGYLSQKPQMSCTLALVYPRVRDSRCRPGVPGSQSPAHREC